MPVQTIPLTIRERGSDELSLAVAINNAAMPADLWITEEQLRIQEGLDRPDEPPLRLIAFAGDKPVAQAFAGRNIFTAEGRCRLGIQVIPEFRRKGIATELYQQLTAFARERNATALRLEIDEHYLPVVQSWLTRERYYEIERMRPSELRLDEMDFEAWRSAEDQVEAQGLTLTTMAAEDSEANRRKLWEVSEVVRQHVPHHGPSDPFPFEQFDDLMNRPEARPGCLVIAKDGNGYVGFTLLVHQTPERALTGLTGVLPEYRSRGLALALKVRCARLAKQAGYTSMRTFNHVNNPAMLKVNDRLGYTPLPHEILFQKDVEEEKTR